MDEGRSMKQEDLSGLKPLAEAEEGDRVFWKSQGVSKLRLRVVTKSDEENIYLQDHLYFNRRGRCVSDFRHGGLLEPTIDHKAKYLRQQRRFADTDRIHSDRLNIANEEHLEAIRLWALETVRDLEDAENENERVELLIEAASKLTGGATS